MAADSSSYFIWHAGHFSRCSATVDLLIGRQGAFEHLLQPSRLTTGFRT